MWSKIGKNKQLPQQYTNKNSQRRNMNAQPSDMNAMCPVGNCCKCNFPTNSESQITVEETEQQYFQPSSTSFPLQKHVNMVQEDRNVIYNTSNGGGGPPQFNQQMPISKLYSPKENTPGYSDDRAGRRVSPTVSNKSTTMSMSTFNQYVTKDAQTTPSLFQLDSSPSPARQLPCLTLPVQPSPPRRLISSPTRPQISPINSAQHPLPSVPTPNPVVEATMENLIVGLTTEGSCQVADFCYKGSKLLCCCKKRPTKTCKCRFTQINKTSSRDQKKRSEKSNKERKREEKQRRKQEKERQKREQKEEKARRKQKKKEEANKKSRKKRDRSEGLKDTQICTCCNCVATKHVPEAESDNSSPSNVSKKRKDKQKKIKNKEQKKPKSSKKKERTKSPKGMNDKCKTECIVVPIGGRPCNCPEPRTQRAPTPCKDAPAQQQEEIGETVKSNRARVGSTMRRLQRECSPPPSWPCHPCQPQATNNASRCCIYNQKPPAIISEVVCQEYTREHSLNGEVGTKLQSSSCSCFQTKSVCSCNCSRRQDNCAETWRVMEQPRAAFYSEATTSRQNGSVSKNDNGQSEMRYQNITAAPAMFVPNIQMGNGDSNEPNTLNLGNLVQPSMGPQFTRLPASYSPNGNLVINVSKKKDNSGAKGWSSNRHFVPPCVLYLDCTKVKDICVIIRDKYEDHN